MVALEFDQLWKPASTFTTSSIRLPAFLSTVKLIKETLSAWSTANRQVEEGRVDSSPNPSTSAISERASNINDNAPEDLLIIPLEDAYCPTNFSFSALRESDCHALKKICPKSKRKCSSTSTKTFLFSFFNCR